MRFAALMALHAMRRLDQLLSSLGYCSRREAMAFVKEGRVKLAGVVLKRSDQRVDSALITVDDLPLEAPEGLLAMLHKDTLSLLLRIR